MRVCFESVIVLCALLLQDELPYNDYFEYYGPDYRLHISPSNMENLNDRAYLDGVVAKVPTRVTLI